MITKQKHQAEMAPMGHGQPRNLAIRCYGTDQEACSGAEKALSITRSTTCLEPVSRGPFVSCTAQPSTDKLPNTGNDKNIIMSRQTPQPHTEEILSTNVRSVSSAGQASKGPDLLSYTLTLGHDLFVMPLLQSQVQTCHGRSRSISNADNDEKPCHGRRHDPKGSFPHHTVRWSLGTPLQR